MSNEMRIIINYVRKGVMVALLVSDPHCGGLRIEFVFL